jgi:hypothetical protein
MVSNFVDRFINEIIHYSLTFVNLFLVIRECMQMPGWQMLMRSAILCSRAEYFIDQYPTNRQVPLGEWFVVAAIVND